MLEQRLDTLEMHYRNMIYNAYKHRDSRLWFMYILASDNMEQGYRRWSYLKNYSKAINGQAEKIRGLKEELNARIKEVEKLRTSTLAAQASRTKEYKSLTAEEKQSQAFAKSLDSKQSQYRKELAKKRQEADRLARQVERMIAQEIEKERARKAEEQRAADSMKAAVPAQQQQQASSQQQASQPHSSQVLASAETVQLSGSFALNKGKLPFPVTSGVIVEKFGEHPHPTLKNVKLPFNNGINISTKPGSNVKAVFDGVVKQVIAIPGYNQCILVQHGKYFTFYCKLSTVVVKVGDKVSTGTLIGALDPMGSTATLHFELWNGTTKQNPELWLKK